MLDLSGTPRLHTPGGTVVFAAERRFQLLALLALSADWVPREQVAQLLWPEHATPEARRNLRKVLLRAREVPGADTLEATEHALRWPVPLRPASGDACVPLMQGLDDPANPAWSDWLEQQRLQHQRRWRAEAGARLAALQAPAELLSLALQLLQADAFDEVAMAAALRAELALGQRAQAQRRYAEHARRLADELGTEPAPALRALFEAPPPVAAVPPAPAPDADFVGRRLELAEAQALLARAECRLLTVLGPGGIGKSRVARAVLARVAPLFPGGAQWVELQDLADLPSVLGRLAQQLGLSVGDGGDMLLQIAQALPAARQLLVLDNAEHLPGLPAALARLIEQAPGVCLLVTSRVRLHGGHEWLLPLAGLAVPDEHSRDLEAASAFDAVRLFERRALAADRRFSLAEHLDAVVDICAAVDGLPLAVELAAGWVRLMPPAEIARDLAASMDLLARDPAAPGVPARPDHVHVRRVLERSWQRLADGEAQALAALSVLRGGFTRAAAQAVAGVSLPLLSALVDCSLLQVDEQGRFNAHPLVQALAAERLAEDPAREAVLRQRHAAHFAAWMAERAPLTRGRMDLLLQDVTGEFANVRQAWQQALRAQDARQIGQIVRAWWVYFEMTGRLVEGTTLIDPALALPPATPEARWALARVRHGLSMLHHRRGNHVEGLGIALAGVGYGEDCGDLEAWIGCVLNSGSCHWMMGGLDEAHAAFCRALDVARRHGDRHCTAWALGNLGICLSDRGEVEASLALLHEALATDRELGNQYQVVVHLINLSTTLINAGRLQEALPFNEEALALATRHGLRGFALNARANLGALLTRLGRLAEARAQLEACHADACRGGHVVLQIGSLGQLGRLALRDGDRAGALRRIRESVHLAQARSMAPDVLRMLRGWAMVLEHDGDPVGAARVYLMLQREPVAVAPDVAWWQTCVDQLALSPAQLAAAQARVPTLAQVLADLEAAFAGRDTGRDTGRDAGRETPEKRPPA